MKKWQMVKWVRTEGYKEDNNYEVEGFIKGFIEHADPSDEHRGNMHYTFRAGYCWHFAHMLHNTFGRGQVVWAAPFGHICWQDETGIVYDIEGEYCGEAYYMIPEEFMEHMCKDIMSDFKHNGKEYGATKTELINICKEWCRISGEKYEDSIETHFRN